jgi:hypothetical protein
MLLSLAAALLYSVQAAPQQGALTVSRNLQQLTDRAAIIVRGNIVGARVEVNPELGVNTLVVTLKVRETLKGPERSTLTFRQYVWGIRDRAHADGYRKGDDLLLLMIAPSRYGLSSPAGMEQGRFLIKRDVDGRELALNGHGNVRLFEGVAAQVAKQGIQLSPASVRLLQRPRIGPVQVGELTGLIRDLVNGSP